MFQHQNSFTKELDLDLLVNDQEIKNLHNQIKSNRLQQELLEKQLQNLQRSIISKNTAKQRKVYSRSNSVASSSASSAKSTDSSDDNFDHLDEILLEDDFRQFNKIYKSDLEKKLFYKLTYLIILLLIILCSFLLGLNILEMQTFNQLSSESSGMPVKSLTAHFTDFLDKMQKAEAQFESLKNSPVSTTTATTNSRSAKSSERPELATVTDRLLSNWNSETHILAEKNSLSDEDRSNIIHEDEYAYVILNPKDVKANDRNNVRSKIRFTNTKAASGFTILPKRKFKNLQDLEDQLLVTIKLAEIEYTIKTGKTSNNPFRFLQELMDENEILTSLSTEQKNIIQKNLQQEVDLLVEDLKIKHLEKSGSIVSASSKTNLQNIQKLKVKNILNEQLINLSIEKYISNLINLSERFSKKLQFNNGQVTFEFSKTKDKDSDCSLGYRIKVVESNPSFKSKGEM